MGEPLINLRNVDFAYRPDRPVLRGCSLALSAGGRVALCGANGSGKTTLLHLIVGLLKPSAGVIEVFGRERRKENDFHEVRRRVGLLFQEPDDQLFCPTVLEDVAFGPLNLGLPREEVRRIVAETLEQLGLAGYQSRITYQLSGGEKRLVALATVLAMRPDVLLLDEPAGGLDDEAAERLLRILSSLPQAMIFVSHDHQFRRQMATHAMRLHEGRIEEADPLSL
jgi:cobalt/nickel transport system ATP-binding protein